MSAVHVPKKQLGQNFLTDLRIQQKIIDSCQLTSEDTVLEIGPGQGVLTRLIAPKVRRLICVEADKDLIAALRDEFNGTNVDIVHADFLKFDLSSMPPGLKVIGNIPYYISTPIVERLIEHSDKINAAYLTVQLEFGERLAAKSGGKEYGSLSCFAQINAKTAILFKISKSSFKPVPKVDSCFISLDFTQAPQLNIKDKEALFKLIRTSFAQRRKNILNAFAPICNKERLMPILEELKISPKARPEELNIEKFVLIANRLV